VATNSRFNHSATDPELANLSPNKSFLMRPGYDLE